MYKTSDNAEELDLCDELNSYDSVGHALDRTSFWGIEDEYRNVDFYIMMLDYSEEEEIKNLLNEFGMTAWLEYDEKMAKY